MLWSAHPPRQTPELAYIFLLPILIWFYFRPTLSKVLVCSFVGWIYQIAMVGWMRHVSFGGMRSNLLAFLLQYHLVPFCPRLDETLYFG